MKFVVKANTVKELVSVVNTFSKSISDSNTKFCLEMINFWLN